jgi:hypothetical protein
MFKPITKIHKLMLLAAGLLLFLIPTVLPATSNPLSLLVKTTAPVIIAVPIGDGSEHLISMTTTADDATIYYTTDGSAPNRHSKEYDPMTDIMVSGSTTIRAMATALGHSDSAVAAITIGK